MKIKRQLIRAQGLFVKAGALVDGVRAILSVSKKRMPDACQMRTDLMRTTGDQMHFQQRCVSISLNRMK